MNINFFNEFVEIPGGLTDWFSALLMQFWFSDLSTAVYLTICFGLVSFLTRKFMESLKGNRLIHTFHLIPAILLVVLHGQYDYHLSITVALIINLLFLNLIIRWNPKQRALQIISFLTISFLLFWITGGAFLIFAVLYGFSSVLSNKKQIPITIFILSVCIALPYAASASIFLVTAKHSYLHNLLSKNLIKLWYIEYILLAFYPAVIISAALSKIAIVRKVFDKFTGLIRLKRLSLIWQCIIGTIILLSGAVLLTQRTYDDNLRLVLKVNQSVKENRWQDVINSSMQCSIVNPLLSFQTNIALFESGILLDRIFAFPQFYGTAGLFMDHEWSSTYPEKTGDLYWKIGLVNESLHWTHEAFELNGPTPEILKQLGMIYLVKGDNAAAKKFFLNLRNVPFHKNIADDLIQVNENPDKLAHQIAIVHNQSCMPAKDLTTLGTPIPEKLELLLKHNPKNKMAFEYLIAFYLMNGDLQGLLDHFADAQAFTYSHIPRHIQEAMLVIASMNPAIDKNQLKNIVQPATYQRFVNFQQILNRHQDNLSSAKQELQKQFGDTYWYYLMYVRPGARQTEGHNEFQ